MKPIGGFFELELPPAGNPHHAGAVAFASGRACMTAALIAMRPDSVRLPFYCCDAVLEPIRRLGIRFDYYRLDDALEPADELVPRPGEACVAVNYFGLKSDACRRLAETWKDRLIVDNTQAYFRKNELPAWSFNSARKFFGVPDGGYLYAPSAVPAPTSRNDDASWDHLILRLRGRQEEAFQAFQRNESSVTCEPMAMSLGADRVLRSVDPARVADIRRRNYDHYHAILGPANCLRLPRSPDAVPFCYPFLPPRPADRARLSAMKIFIPTLWSDCLDRAETGFDWECDLSRRLLPLPVDQRCDEADIQRVVEAIR